MLPYSVLKIHTLHSGTVQGTSLTTSVGKTIN